ncbi:dTDP-glucose 4,6-dehydratase [Amycolatopsis sacchari]|uniref:dTDP-glucose 4,6-dehydratase n=1 Tax=Amycolatopsis sacchari TaxID=115433 RepID=A0A1I3V288_9PSEU|nr:SDR family NAD(P)-dependent oxidoreductase [Amycolatopsis sacchari]SFJ88486.1 dTDP-glucose 4,6-dehydratase [Amycolatopsis sacchari]
MNRLAGKRALVTGADGFIGSHLVQRLLADGVEVRALCLYNSDNRMGCLEQLSAEELARVEVIFGDIRDFRSARDAVAGVDVVFHLAALISVPYSYVAPVSFLHTNVSGTVNVLEAVREHEGVKMVHTSTSEVYGTPETVPISEAHPLRAQSPYAASKVAADQFCQSYARSFGVNVVTLRPFNTYGPRQSARAVIPTVLTQLLAGLPTIRLGSLRPQRDFTFVTDTVDGFVRMAETDLEPGSLVQLGVGSTVSIGDLVELCRELTGSDSRIEVEEQRIRPERSEVEILLSNPERARRELGWEPTVSLREGLMRTIDQLKAGPEIARAGSYQR